MKKGIAVFALAAPLLLAGAGVFAQGHAGHAGHEGMAVKETSEQTKAPAKAKKGKAKKAALRKVTAEEIGVEAACPVTGEKFSVTEKTVSASYKGKVYYFCCPDCKKPFIGNPEKYLNKEQPPLNKTYVCPMGCAQSDKPGKCPKCGMGLVEKKLK